MNDSRSLSRIAPFLFIIFLLSAGQAAASTQSGGPDLQVLQVYGNFETSRPSSIFIVLQNNADPSEMREGAGGLQWEADPETARSILAGLVSADDRIEILSGPQMAGLLPAGENLTVQFTALAQGAPIGIYPLILRLNYSRLSGVRQSREDGLAGFVFVYERLSRDISVPVEVVQGPKVVLEKTSGRARPGEGSKLSITIANRGDEPAVQLSMQARPSAPFLMVENAADEVCIAPGESAELSLSVFTDENATQGYYALPCIISYRDEAAPEDGGGLHWEQRREELVGLVYVGEEGAFIWLYIAVAGLVLLAVISLARRRLTGKGRRLRIVRS